MPLKHNYNLSRSILGVTNSDSQKILSSTDSFEQYVLTEFLINTFTSLGIKLGTSYPRVRIKRVLLYVYTVDSA